MTLLLPLIFSLQFLLILPSPVRAQKIIPFYFYSKSSLLTWWRQCAIAGLGPQNQVCNIGPLQLISLLLPNLLIIAGLIFFFLILGGGFMLIHGAGKESSPQDKAKAQGAITYGVIGFLLVVSAYFILQVISNITGINFYQPF